MTRRVWAGIVLFAASVGVAVATQPPGDRPGPPPAGGRPKFLPETALDTQCLGCHKAGPATFPDSAAFVLLSESVIWKDHDLHSRAFDALGSPLGEQISRRLYNGDPKAARSAAECLVCHATDTTPGAPLADPATDRFSCKYGVNCQACHGGAADWWSMHQDRTKWRVAPPDQKAKLGQVALRQPAVRAGKCVSCHVGSVTDGRFVTHAMYAAGHPPLPPVELATFSRDEPRHWRPTAAVEYIANLPPADARRLFGYRKGEVESARLVAVGAVTVLRESARLVGFGPTPAGGMLDFAHFNCAACHHELRVNGDRQKSGFPGTPGRPVPQTWPVWVTRAVLRHAADVRPEAAAVRDRFEAAYREFRMVFDKTPFGDKSEAVEKAEALARECDAVLKALDGIDYTPTAARSLVAALGVEANDPSRRDYLDPDGAAQIARAAAVILDELAKKPTAPGLQLDKRAPPPTFPDSPLRELHAVVGLTLRDAYTNSELLQTGDVYPGRFKRAVGYESGKARGLFAELTKRFAGP